MTSTSVLPPLVDRAQPRTARLVVDLLLPQPRSCAPCQNAIEEIDEAAAFLAPELAARGTSMRVRVTTRTDPVIADAHGVRSLVELRVNGIAIESDGTQDCGHGSATQCGTYEWDGETYAAPPAELLTAVIHDHLDGDIAAPQS
jgi:hypothetical protein